MLLKLLAAWMIVVALMMTCRLTFDYLAEIALIDYTTYSGVVALMIALLAFDGDHPTHQHFFSMMVHRELVSRDNDAKDQLSNVSFSLAIGSAGLLLIIISGVMAWLN